MPEGALQLFDEMQQQGLEPNVTTYTAVRDAGELILQLFDKMQRQGLQANLITYRRFVQAAPPQCMWEGQAASRGDGAPC